MYVVQSEDRKTQKRQCEVKLLPGGESFVWRVYTVDHEKVRAVVALVSYGWLRYSPSELTRDAAVRLRGKKNQRSVIFLHVKWLESSSSQSQDARD